MIHDGTAGGAPLVASVCGEDDEDAPPAAFSAARRRVVLISAYHDYRTGKRASIHQIADGLVDAGFDVSFVSTRFSTLSKVTGDSRLFLWRKANRVETVNGIRCLLWRTLVHPFSSRARLVQKLSGYAYESYAEARNAAFDQLVREADYIVVESGAAAIYLRRIRRLNPRATLVYYAADRLETIKAHPFIQRRLSEDAGAVSHFSLRATQLAGDFPNARGPLYKASFGISEEDFAGEAPNPYPVGQKVAVSVGSMLFDSSVFQLAAASFPDMQFHVIGCGAQFDAPANVHIHPEMPFEQTLAYVKHASVGIAAYAPVAGAEYLAESSLKLAQFEYFGLPAICPDFAAGSSPFRFGYEPGDAGSIREAMSRALSVAHPIARRTFPSWKEVALQVIEPERYGASRIG